MDEVINCLRAAWHGVQAAQQAVSVSSAGRGNGKDITLGQQPEERQEKGASGKGSLEDKITIDLTSKVWWAAADKTVDGKLWRLLWRAM